MMLAFEHTLDIDPTAPKPPLASDIAFASTLEIEPEVIAQVKAAVDAIEERTATRDTTATFRLLRQLEIENQHRRQAEAQALAEQLAILKHKACPLPDPQVSASVLDVSLPTPVAKLIIGFGAISGLSAGLLSCLFWT
ncbi:MAG: hypothetical protein AAFS10_01235 [Myxococcota bacterium]